MPESKHLDGSNYNEWNFWLKSFLIDAGLWHCIEPREGQIIDPDLDKRTLAKINLSLKPSVAKITKSCETASGAWNSLQREFESNTIVRMIKMYSNLFSTKFENFSSMNQYVDHILEICEQLENLGEPFRDNVIGAIILGGLPENFTPLILGIQGSQQDTTVEFVKQLLLQDGIKDLGVSKQSETEGAFSRKAVKNGPRCFSCGNCGHIRKDC